MSEEPGCFGYHNDDLDICADCRVGIDCMVARNNKKPLFSLPVVEMFISDDSAMRDWIEVQRRIQKKIREAFAKALKDLGRFERAQKDVRRYKININKDKDIEFTEESDDGTKDSKREGDDS